MALKACKECGNQVSKSAKSCPHCGAKQGTSFVTKLVAGFLILIIIGAMSSIDKKPHDNTSTSSNNAPSNAQQPKPVEKPTPVSAVDLLADYKANEIAADQKYKGKLLSVSGEVGNIKKGMMGGMYITLKSGEQLSFSSVQCFFDKQFQGRLVKLKQGQSITVTGRCGGLLGNVSLKDCSF